MRVRRNLGYYFTETCLATAGDTDVIRIVRLTASAVGDDFREMNEEPMTTWSA